MKELIIKIEQQLQNQVDHICRNYEQKELKQKMYDLAIEWYVKGIKSWDGLKNEGDNER
jgi:hypothetical protein